MNASFEASHCFICNLSIPRKDNEESSMDGVDIFNDENILPTKRTLEKVLREIINNELLYKGQVKSTLCKNCYKNVADYDSAVLRLKSMKASILLQYNSANKLKQKISKVVIPGSKLMPLPSKYVIVDRDSIELKKMLLPAKTETPKYVVNVTTNSSLNITTTTSANERPKITLDSSFFRSPVKTKKPDLEQGMAEITELSAEKRSMPVIRVSSGTILNFELPNNFLDPTALIKEESGKQDPLNVDVMNSDEQPMEIDEECSYTISKTSSNVDFNKVFEEHLSKPKPIKKEETQTVFDMIEELNEADDVETEEGDHDYVVGELQYLHHEEPAQDDESSEAIMMSGEDGSVIKVLSSQHLMYGDSEIALIIPQDGSESRDSNDDSQIELQVSGDEETANAIIAAAKEQGGAFIKVENGEMYRVKSVQSKTVDEDDVITEVPKQMLIVREGSLYKCQICANRNQTTDENEETSQENAKSANFSTTEGPAMTQHFKLTHNTRIYICNICGEVFRKRIDFNKHYAQHDDSESAAKKNYECNFCKKKCGSSSLLEAHYSRAHGGGVGGAGSGGGGGAGSGGVAHVCAHCNKTFASKYTHQAHLKTHQDRPRPFSCKTCKKTFFTQANLTQHEKTHWGVKDFVCKFCKKAFGTQHNLDVHGVVHSGVKPFLCGICGKSFARKAEIRDHIRVHTGERPFACDICGATFSQRSNLQSHIRATHSLDRRHACTQCDKRFKRRRLLDYHIRASHTGERPYKCDVCKTSFVYPEHYKKHQRIHSGEKPYVCEVCGKSFNTRDNRNAHRFVHSDKKPYECLVCGAGYMRKPLLIAHMNTSGHLTESIVVNQPRVTQEETATIQIQNMDGTPFEVNGAKVHSSDCQEDNKLFITTNGDKKIFLQGSVGKSSLNLVLEGDEEILTQNLVESNERIDASLLDSISSEDIEKGTQIVANDENGGMVRLVQIQLSNGNTGWIALD